MSEETWITNVGESAWAAINTLWAACRLEGHRPTRVVVLTGSKPNLAPQRQTFIQWAREITAGYAGKAAKLHERVLDEEDMVKFSSALGEAIRQEREARRQVLLDMTPGRKYMSAITLALGLRYGDTVRAIYYLLLRDNRYLDTYFPRIPSDVCMLYNLKKLYADPNGEVGPWPVS